MTHGKPLSDPPADVMTNEASVVDPEQIQQLDDPIGVRANSDRLPIWSIASSISEQVHHNHAVAWWNEWYDLAPEMTRRGEAVQKNHGLSGSPGTGGVVIDANAVQVDELTAHPLKKRRAADVGSPSCDFSAY